MNNNISYGPHLFPGGPEYYIRSNKPETLIKETHEKIRDTLIASFSNDVPESLINQVWQQLEIDTNAETKIAFMNYGDTQLVYLATINNTHKFATLINQPHTPLGKVKEEFENLKRMTEIDPRFVVKPLAYFIREEKWHELYMSEYINNALCIAHNEEHGIYDPLPYYHFETFEPKTSSIIHKNMIALLVNYYDKERGKWLAETQVSGNDFLLTREAEMKIIWARKYMDIPFNEYLDLLRKEFVIGTNRTEDTIWKDILINHRSKKPMTPTEIEEGIQIGIQLNKQHQEKKL